MEFIRFAIECERLGRLRAEVYVPCRQDEGRQERRDYYPFGKAWKASGMPSEGNRYIFSGKEESGLWLDDEGETKAAIQDFGARYYDSEGVMWLSQDPKAENNYGFGQYVYCGGNTVWYIDPTCEFPIETIWDIGNVVYDVGAVVNHIKGDHKTARSHWANAALDAGTNKVIKGGAAGVKALDKAGDAGKVGKYSNVTNPKNVKDGSIFTRIQNKKQNGAVIRSDQSGKVLDTPTPSIKGQKANMNQAEIDHIDPKSKGGTNRSSNAQVLSKEENIRKGNRRYE